MEKALIFNQTLPLGQAGAACETLVNGLLQSKCLTIPSINITMPVGIKIQNQLTSGKDHLIFQGIDLNQQSQYYAFGQNQFGQLGFFDVANHLPYSFIPVPIFNRFAPNKISKPILGANQSYLLMENGSLYATGANDQGQLLNQSLQSQELYIPVVQGNIVQFEAGPYSACALVNDQQRLILKCGGACHGSYLGIGICNPCLESDYILKPVIWN